MPKAAEASMTFILPATVRDRFNNIASAMGLTQAEMLECLIELASPVIVDRARKQLEREHKRVEKQRIALDRLMRQTRGDDDGGQA